MIASKSVSIDAANRACISWLDEIAPVLKDSGWGAALELEGIPLLESLLVPLTLELLALARDARARPIRPRWRDRALGWFPLPVREWLLEQRGGGRQAHRLSQTPAPAEVVFWPRMGNHSDGQVPVAKALQQMGHSASFVVDNPMRLAQLHYGEIKGVYHRAAWSPAIQQARRHARKLTRILDADPGRALPPFAGTPEKVLVHCLRAILKSELARVAEIIAAANEVVRTIKPRIVVVGNDLTLEGRTVALCMRGHGIKSACLMHGNLSAEVEHARHVVDRYFVFGNTSRNVLLSCGAAPTQVEVTGATYIKNVPSQSGRVDPRIAEYLALHPGQPWILVATSGPGHKVSRTHHLAVTAALAELSAALPGIPIVAKLHRKDQPGYYEQALASVPGSRLKVIAHGTAGLPSDIWTWLQGCSLVITGGSAAGIEALLMDVPVVSIDLAGELSSVDFIEAGVTPHVEDGRDLPGVVRGVLKNEQERNELRQRAKAFLGDTFASFGAQAAERTAQRLLALANANGQA